jgi:hypothetical protein
MGPTALISLAKEDVLQVFIALKNPSPLTAFELANVGSSVKHVNH